MVVSIILSMLTYIASCVFLKKMIDISSIDGIFAAKILILSLISWAPMWIFRVTKECVDPSDHEIIMRSAKAVRLGNSKPSESGKLQLGFD